jgi:hypothetical protein
MERHTLRGRRNARLQRDRAIPRHLPEHRESQDLTAQKLPVGASPKRADTTPHCRLAEYAFSLRAPTASSGGFLCHDLTP